jgi:phage shock protein C
MEPRKLYRSETNKMLGGVCAGLGEYFNIDPTIVRLVFVLAALLAGHGILVYVILWIVIPPAPSAINQPITTTPAPMPPDEQQPLS